MSVNSELKNEPTSPWLSYINIDDCDIFGDGTDVDLGVRSDDGWGSDGSEKHDLQEPDILSEVSSVKEDPLGMTEMESNGRIYDDVRHEDTAFYTTAEDEKHDDLLGYKGKEIEVWAANADSVDSLNFWGADQNGSQVASSVVPSSDAGDLCLPAYRGHYGDRSWTLPEVLPGESSKTMSPQSISPYRLHYCSPLAHGGHYGDAGGFCCSQEQQSSSGIPHYHQDDGMLECVVNMQQIELGGKSGNARYIGNIGDSGRGSTGQKRLNPITMEERLNTIVSRDMHRFGELHNIKNVLPKLLYLPQQNSYMWESDATASMAAQGSAMHDWAPSTGFLEPAASQQTQMLHTSNGGHSQVLLPAQTENSGTMVLPLRQAVTTSQPQLLPVAPVVPSSFSPAAPGAWPETQLDYYSQAEAASSSSSDVYLAGNRTKLPEHRSSARDYISRHGSSGSQQQTEGGGQRACNSSAGTLKSPIYKTRQVTRRQMKQRQQQKIDVFQSKAARAESSYQQQDMESWSALLPLQTYVGMVEGNDETRHPGLQYGLQKMQQPLPDQEELPSSSKPQLSEASQQTLQSQAEERLRKDTFLIEQKRAGLTYKQIRRLGGFHEAESTLRGRHRTLTKPKEERVRKPTWTEMDDHLLRRAVRKFCRGRDNSKVKIPWKAVADYIFEYGGSYHFGNTTCRKRWDLLVELS